MRDYHEQTTIFPPIYPPTYLCLDGYRRLDLFDAFVQLLLRGLRGQIKGNQGLGGLGGEQRMPPRLLRRGGGRALAPLGLVLARGGCPWRRRLAFLARRALSSFLLLLLRGRLLSSLLLRLLGRGSFLGRGHLGRVRRLLTTLHGHLHSQVTALEVRPIQNGRGPRRVLGNRKLHKAKATGDPLGRLDDGGTLDGTDAPAELLEVRGGRAERQVAHEDGPVPRVVGWVMGWMGGWDAWGRGWIDGQAFDLLRIIGGGIHDDDGWLRDSGRCSWVSLACGLGCRCV
jgi:hypothetical protein